MVTSWDEPKDVTLERKAKEKKRWKEYGATGVREYAEGYPVHIEPVKDKNGGVRICIVAENEGGFGGTSVDLEDVIKWVKSHESNPWWSKFNRTKKS